MSTSKVVMGFFIGAALGGLLGVLFAPDEGKKTRRKIIEKGNDMSDAIKEKFNDFVDTVKDNFSSGKKAIEDVQEKGVAFKNKIEGNRNLA